MKMQLNYLLIVITSIVLFNCGGAKPKRNNFIGIWKANDGAMVELYDNGKCKVSKMDYYKIYPFDEYKNRLLNFSGTWTFTDDEEPKIHLSYTEGKTYKYKGETKEYKAGFDFSILGQGAFGNKPPWHLYMFIGDPDDIDESNKYKFIKD